MFTPQKLNEKEIDELAQLILDDGTFGCETLDEAKDYVLDYPTAKFTNYITDGPGYSGDIYVLTGGIPHTSTIVRDKTGNMIFSNA